MRKLFGEAIGAFCLVFAGCGAIVIDDVTHGGGTATSTGNQACSATCSDPILTGNGTWQGYTPN